MLKRTLALGAFAALAVLAQDASIAIDARKTAPYRIPRTIYGTFLEPIGNSIYGGLWAQLLENPSFEGGLWNTINFERKLEANPALNRASSLGLPTPWEPLDSKQGTRYEPRWNDAANSYRSLLVMALPDKQTGIRQQVYLPVHRTLRYTGTLYAKLVAGPALVEVSIRGRNRPAEVFSRSTLSLAGTGWKQYEFALELGRGQVAHLDPADFVIAVSDGTRVLLDQVLLFPADNVEGMDPDMVAMAKALRTPIVRYGGNFTSAYHWRDGIGPMDRRVSMLNLAWGIPEYNHFGTDEFLEFCRLIGAEPQIALNLGTGTPREAAEWVEYVNQHWNSGHGGLWWELGNELWGDFQTGYPTLAKIRGLTSTFSSAVHAADSAARLIATGADPDHFEQWNGEQLKNPPSTFNALSTHFVVGPSEVVRKQASAAFVANAAFALPVELERRLRAMKEQIDRTPGRGNVNTAFTEWLFAGRSEQVPGFSNMAGAICAAGMLNTLMRVADFTTISDMTGLVEFGGIWKKREQVYGVPAYWAFRMYSTAAGVRPVAVDTRVDTYDVTEGNRRLPEISRVPYLDVVAALDDTGERLTLFVVNRHQVRNISTRIRLDGFRASGTAQVRTLQASSIYSVNDEKNPEAVVPVESSMQAESSQLAHVFPRSSVTVIEFHQ